MDSELKGANEMILALGNLEQGIAKKYLRQALRAGAKFLQRALVINAPFKSGLTRSAIRVRAGKQKAGSVSMQVQIGAGDFKGDTFYAGFVNYGFWLNTNRVRRVKYAIKTYQVWQERYIPGTMWTNKTFDQVKDLVVTVINEQMRVFFYQEMRKQATVK